MTLEDNFVCFATAFQLCCLLEAEVLNCPHHFLKGETQLCFSLSKCVKALFPLSILIKEIISYLGLWSFEMLI